MTPVHSYSVIVIQTKDVVCGHHEVARGSCFLLPFWCIMWCFLRSFSHRRQNETNFPGFKKSLETVPFYTFNITISLTHTHGIFCFFKKALFYTRTDFLIYPLSRPFYKAQLPDVRNTNLNARSTDMYSGSAPGSVYQTFGGCMHRGLLTSADGTPMEVTSFGRKHLMLSYGW